MSWVQQTACPASSDLIGVEGVALIHVTTLEASGKPALPLCRGAMREAVRSDPTRALPLQCVVTDPTSSIEGFFDIALFEGLALRSGAMGPDSCQAVGLKFQSHRELVRLGLRQTPLHLLNLLINTKLMLNMVTDLMGDHIRLGEISRRTHLLT